MKREKLMTHLAGNMLMRGTIMFENHRSNEYCCADIYEVISGKSFTSMVLLAELRRKVRDVRKSNQGLCDAL